MTTVRLTPGDHTIEWSLDGYETIVATINISFDGVMTCINVVGGLCSDLVSIVGSTITGLLKTESTPPTTFDSWIESKGGMAAIQGNLLIMGMFIDGYFGSVDIGFTPSLLNMGTFIDYYFGNG